MGKYAYVATRAGWGELARGLGLQFRPSALAERRVSYWPPYTPTPPDISPVPPTYRPTGAGGTDYKPGIDNVGLTQGFAPTANAVRSDDIFLWPQLSLTMAATANRVAASALGTVMAFGCDATVIPGALYVTQGVSLVAGTYSTTNFDGYGSGGERYTMGPQIVYRSLVQFDVSGVTYTTITSATLRLFLYYANDYPNVDQAITAARVLIQWAEDEATWNRATTSVNWTTPGCSSVGNDRTAASGSAVVLGTHALYASIDLDVTGFVQDWVLNSEPNYGLLLMNTDETGPLHEVVTTTSDDWNPPHKPMLTIVGS